MKYFRLAYKDNATSTTHVEDVRAVSAEEMKGFHMSIYKVDEVLK